jgi:hypothetical protein
MPRRTISDLLAQANTTLPDNILQEITAADVRDMIKDVIDTFKPGFGAVGNPLTTLVALGITPVVIPYTQLLAVTAEYTAVIASGTVRRNALGLPTVNDRITFFADVACPDGNEVVFSLYRDGLQVPGGMTVSGRGLGNIAAGSFSILSGTAIVGDPVYEVRAAKISGGADNVELSNVRLILEVIPTLGL